MGMVSGIYRTSPSGGLFAPQILAAYIRHFCGTAYRIERRGGMVVTIDEWLRKSTRHQSIYSAGRNTGQFFNIIQNYSVARVNEINKIFFSGSRMSHDV